MQTQRIRSIKPLGLKHALDLEVAHKDHNFYADGVVVSNCHATAYALISAWTLYLKVTYPLQFYLACLRQIRKDKSKKHEQLAVVEREMRATNLTLLPPHLIKSDIDFKIETPTSIRYGLALIRGSSGKKIDKLDSFRLTLDGNAWPSKFAIFQAMKKEGLDIGVVSSIVQAGCLEGYGKTRSRLVLEAQTWNVLSDTEKSLCLILGSKPEIDWDVLNAIVYLKDHTNEQGKPLFSRKTRFDTIKRKYEPYKQIYEMNRRNESLACYFYERTVLGYSYSHSLRQIFGDYTAGLRPVSEALAAPADTPVRLIGFVKDDVFRGKTKAGNDSLKFTLADETDEVMVRLFNDSIKGVESMNGRLPECGDLVIVEGAIKDGGCVFAKKCGLQSASIYTKLSQLKDEAKKGAKAAAATEAADTATDSIPV